MQILFVWVFKLVRKLVRLCSDTVNHLVCQILFYGQNVKCRGFKTNGLPFVSVAFGGKCTIGSKFIMNNNLRSNPIGRSQACVLFVDQDAQLTIGNNVGISQTAIVCHLSITIGNDVKIGAGVCIYDTDFHSLKSDIRLNSRLDMEAKIKRPVLIKDNAFIGAHSTILKGVTIGKNSVIGACSVVTKDVEDNEVWAGNPAKLVKILPASEKKAKSLSDFIVPEKLIEETH